MAFAVLSGRYHCSQEAGNQSEHPGGGAKRPADGGVELYLGELREMMRKLLQDEDIHDTVRYNTLLP